MNDAETEGFDLLSASELAQFVLKDQLNTEQEFPSMLGGEAWDLISSFSSDKLKENEFMELLECGDYKKISQRVFYSGMAESVRSKVYPFLLGVYDYGLGLDAKAMKKKKMIDRNEYERLKASWKGRLGDEAFADNLFRIEKDVCRTDRTHPYYPKTKPHQVLLSVTDQISENEKLSQLRDILMTYYSVEQGGFVQGMADLASLFLIVLQNEAETFWCFFQFMAIKKENFLRDGSGINRQLDLVRHLIQVLDPELGLSLPSHLFCAFRWLLVLFRREFSVKDTLSIWDQIMARYLFDDWQIFICLSIFQQHRQKVIALKDEPDELLRYFHSVAHQLDKDKTIRGALDLFDKLEMISFAKGFPLGNAVSLKTVLDQLDASHY
jgi:hypothetical protein